MDESGEQFVAYFLPTDETMAKRAEDASEVMLFWLYQLSTVFLLV